MNNEICGSCDKSQDVSLNNKTELLSRKWDTLNTCSMMCAISCKDPADILAASSFLFSLAVLCSCASLSCVWSLLWLGTVPLQLRLPHSHSFHWTVLRSSFFLGGERANTATWMTWARSDLKVQILVKWEMSLWCCGHVARQHVFGMTFSLFVSRGCPAPGLGWVCAYGQPHQTLSYYLSIFPHCAQRWQLAFSCL